MSKVSNYWIRTLRLINGEFILLDYQIFEFSKKDLRQAFRRFKGDGDVLECLNINAERFFTTKQEMMKYFRDTT